MNLNQLNFSTTFPRTPNSYNSTSQNEPPIANTKSGGFRIALSSANSKTRIKSDIRSRIAETRATYQTTVANQKTSHSAMTAAEQTWKATPLYNFKNRSTLYLASLKAQIKFHKSTKLTQLEQMHLSYLETLEKSGLSEEEQSLKYDAFSKALVEARKTRTSANVREALSVGCSPGVKKLFEAQDAAAKTAALQAEKVVQKLLHELQQPHTELRNNLSANLRYREIELRHANKNDVNTRDKLHSEIQTLQLFITSGALASLKQDQAQELNTLFKEGHQAWQNLQKESSNPQQVSPIKKTDNSDSAEKFAAADRAVILKIREFINAPLKNFIRNLNNSNSLPGNISLQQAFDRLQTLPPERLKILIELMKKLQEQYESRKAIFSENEIQSVNEKISLSREEFFSALNAKNDYYQLTQVPQFEKVQSRVFK